MEFRVVGRTQVNVIDWKAFYKDASGSHPSLLWLMSHHGEQVRWKDHLACTVQSHVTQCLYLIISTIEPFLWRHSGFFTVCIREQIRMKFTVSLKIKIVILYVYSQLFLAFAIPPIAVGVRSNFVVYILPVNILLHFILTVFGGKTLFRVGSFLFCAQITNRNSNGTV
jgi:uncharacterized membrane protein YqaE (UPF0057 family)